MNAKIPFVLAFGLFTAACNHETAKPADTATGTSTSTTGASPTVATMQKPLTVSSEITDACKLDVDNTSTAPKFDYDRTELSDDDRRVLSQVATCVTTGPLKGRRVLLVGRADPRGEEEYNMALGGQRASAARDYLRRAGVDDSRVSVSSRGKLDATGTDEAGYRLDRRVDIELAR